MTLDWHTADYPELRDGPPWVMEEMIAATPQLAAGVLGRPEAAALAARVVAAAAAGEPVVTTGCGTSLHGATAVAELLEEALAQAGSSAHVEARDAFEAALQPRRGGVVVGISHDGGTHATTLALEAAAAAGAATALVTHRPDEACARAAGDVFTTPLADRSWCHTVAYSSAILAGAAGRLLGAAARVVCAGSGCDRVTSRELCLKLEEGVHLPAAHRDLEILLHGHLVACEPGTPIVLVALDRRGRPRRLDRAALLLDAAATLSTPVIVVANADGAGALGGHPVVHACLTTGAPALPEPLDALLAGALALQHLTLAAVHARGTNPDLIRREQAPWREAARALETPGW